jgi:hypothetical protein
MANEHLNQLPRIRCTMRNSEQAMLANVMKKQNGISQFNLSNMTFGETIGLLNRCMRTARCPLLPSLPDTAASQPVLYGPTSCCPLRPPPSHLPLSPVAPVRAE